MSIFPKEIIESTSEYYLDKVNVRSKTIYLLIVFVLLGGIIALPFIFVELSVKARGVLAPRSSRVQIYAPATGLILFNSIKENTQLSRGDTVCIVDTRIIDEQIQFKKELEKETSLYLNDLRKISSADFDKAFDIQSLETEVYISSVRELVQRLDQLKNNIAKTRVDYLRDKKLYKEEVISSKEFEKTKYEYVLAKSNYELAKKESNAQWETEEHQYTNQVNQLNSDLARLKKEREQYYLKAPVSGVIQQYTGIRIGSFVYANQKIAEISPDSTLVIEMYVSPSDIGFVEVGKKVKVQVDAFNYNQWGMLDAEVIEIADDISFIDQQTPVFKIKCSYNQPYLKLKNGYEGYLKKGMTVGGRILITKRSLYQLLYDKVDDWLNPSKA